MMASMVTLCNLVTLVTPGHIWSQVFTLVTGKVKNVNNDDYYGSLASN